jgi:O-antigen ligase
LNHRLSEPAVDRKPLAASYLILAAAAGVCVVLSAEALPRSLLTLFMTYPKLFVVQSLAAAALPLLGLALARSRRIDPWLWLLLAYALWNAASFAWTVWPPGVEALLIRELPCCVLAALAFFLAARPPLARRLMRAFLVALAAGCILQVFVIAVDQAAHRGAPGYTWEISFFGRPSAFGNKNFAAAHIVFGLILIAALAARDIRRLRRTRLQRARRALTGRLAALALLAAPLVFVFVIANSLAGRLALVVGFLAFFLAALPGRRKRRRAIAVALLVVVLGTVLTAVPSLRRRLVDRALTETAQVRVVTGLASLDIFAERPLTGFGAGSFPVVYPSHEPIGARRLPWIVGFASHPHDEWLRVAAETGLPGLLLFAALTLGTLALAAWRIPRLPRPRRAIAWALWAGLISYLTISSVDVSMQFWDVAPVVWILLGLLAGTAASAPPAETAPPPRPVRSPALVAIPLSLLALFAFWQGALRPYRSQMLLSQAVDLKQARRPEAMRRAIDRARPRCATPWEALSLRVSCARLFLQQKRPRQAARLLRSVLREAPDWVGARYLLAASLVQVGELNEAFRHIRAWIVRHPDNPAGYSLLARILVARNRPREVPDVVTALTRACELSGFERPADAELLVRILLAHDRRNEARAFVQRVRDQGKPDWKSLQKLIDTRPADPPR